MSAQDLRDAARRRLLHGGLHPAIAKMVLAIDRAEAGRQAGLDGGEFIPRLARARDEYLAVWLEEE